MRTNDFKVRRYTPWADLVAPPFCLSSKCEQFSGHTIDLNEVQWSRSQIPSHIPLNKQICKQRRAGSLQEHCNQTPTAATRTTTSSSQDRGTGGPATDQTHSAVFLYDSCDYMLWIYVDIRKIARCLSVLGGETNRTEREWESKEKEWEKGGIDRIKYCNMVRRGTIYSFCYS